MSPQRIPHKHVVFQGQTYWWSNQMLSPLDHFGENGELLADPFQDESYAIITDDGLIMRYGRVIGTVADLKDVEDAA